MIHSVVRYHFQAEFEYNNMLKRSSKNPPFTFIYVKILNHTIILVDIPKLISLIVDD